MNFYPVCIWRKSKHFQISLTANIIQSINAIINGIKQLNLEIFDSKIHHDKNLGLSLLVVKTDPGRADNIMQDILNIGIPDDMNFFSYGSLI